ncbi:MAG: DUF559 domain-containing protein [Thermoleophilaceae bacterium]
MRGSNDPGLVERAIVRLAAAQHGVFARWQLLEVGLGADAIQHRVAIGRLHVVHRGVYALSPAPLTTKGHWMAAVLACGPAAVLSHRSAAALWGIASDSSTRTDVTAGRSGRKGPRVVRLHRVRGLHRDDCTLRDGIPVTSLARTLLDFGEIVNEGRLNGAIEEAERRRLLDLRAVEAVMKRNRGRRGLAPLAAALAGYRDPIHWTLSYLERAFVELCRLTGLPAPSINASVLGEEVDALWEAQRLIVEVDSFEFHRTRAAFERDRIRDAKLQAAGYRVLRFTYRRLTDDPALVATQIRALL